MNEQLAAKIRSNPHFIELQSKRKSFAWLLTVLMLIVYYGFIVIDAWAPATFATVVAGPVTLGLVVGFAIIPFTIAITYVYIQRANGEFEMLTQQIVKEAGL